MTRLENKARGRVCGNCASTYPTTDPKRVACMHPMVRKPDQNEMNWYRKTKGGCSFWEPKAHEGAGE